MSDNRGRIKKFILKPQYSEEYEFETTRVTKRVNTISITERTDDNGNPISDRANPNVSAESEMYEEIHAISLPSRQPAKVEVIEREVLSPPKDTPEPEAPLPQEPEAPVETPEAPVETPETPVAPQVQANEQEIKIEGIPNVPPITIKIPNMQQAPPPPVVDPEPPKPRLLSEISPDENIIRPRSNKDQRNPDRPDNRKIDINPDINFSPNE